MSRVPGLVVVIGGRYIEASTGRTHPVGSLLRLATNGLRLRDGPSRLLLDTASTCVLIMGELPREGAFTPSLRVMQSLTISFRHVAGLTLQHALDRPHTHVSDAKLLARLLRRP